MAALAFENRIRELTVDDLAVASGGASNDRGAVDPVPPVGIGPIWHGPIVAHPHRTVTLIGSTV